jgi:hypothetical protein
MAWDSTSGGFRGLRGRRFLPLLGTLFLGALNDNLFRAALFASATMGLLVKAGATSGLLVNGLFILPFLVVPILAGQFADRDDKAAIARGVKLAEMLIMAAALVAALLQATWGLLAVLFALACQSAFFSPVKLAILPHHLRESELVAGNALVVVATCAAILLGSALGQVAHGGLALAGLGLVLAVLGWLASLGIPPAKPSIPRPRIRWNLAGEVVDAVKLARQRRSVWNSILGIAWFWFLGVAYLTQLPRLAGAVPDGVTVLLLCVFAGGLGLGALLCDPIGDHRVEMGLVPLGSLGLSVFGFDLFWAARGYGPAEIVSWLAFPAQWPGLRIVLDLFLIGVFGGFYIVPLQATVQLRTASESRGRVIAFNTAVNALLMVCAVLLGILVLQVATYSTAVYFLILALMNVAVTLYIFRQVPEFAMRFLVWLLTHSLYRVRHRGLDHIPGRGGAIIVANHVSFVDAPLLAGAVWRPIRFIMDKPIYDLPVINFIARVGGAIPISSRQQDAAAYEAAMDRIAEALDRGELLCIFPEGRLTRDGEMNDFKSGIERIVRRSPVPVIPVALRGLWGSFFSHHGGGPFRSRWRPFSRVDVIAGEPVPPEVVTAEGLYRKVAALRADNQQQENGKQP